MHKAKTEGRVKGEYEQSTIYMLWKYSETIILYGKLEKI